MNAFISRPKQCARVAALALSISLAACGGGGDSGSTATVSPSNTSNQGTNIVVAPNVVYTTPADTATNVALNSKISASFNSAIQPTPLTSPATGFSVKDSSGLAIAGTVTIDATNKIAVFSPAAPLAANTRFTATIAHTVTDAAGVALPADFTWAFTTGSALDTIPWTVTLTDPVHDTMNVALKQTIHATFSKSMDPTSITPASFIVEDQDGRVVSGTIAYDAETRTVSFTPTTGYPANTLLTVTITDEVRDLSGNTRASNCAAQNCIWFFKTAAQ